MQTFPISEEQAQQMIDMASKARTKTYPNPNAYAVTVLTKAGNMYEGISYNSDTLTLTMHSEATALAHASIHGELEVIAITGPNCHICKQLIWERSLHTGIDIQVIIEEEGGSYKIVPISEQMPYPWPDAEDKH